jgi:hypothetical protein
MPTATEKDQTTSNQQGAAQNVASFHNPILASVEGEPVTLIALGDVPGMSPAYLCVDQQGQSRWESQRNVQIIDPRALPFSEQAVRNMSSRGGTGSGASGSSSGGSNRSGR